MQQNIQFVDKFTNKLSLWLHWSVRYGRKKGTVDWSLEKNARKNFSYKNFLPHLTLNLLVQKTIQMKNLIENKKKTNCLLKNPPILEFKGRSVF